jgi:hypothetical protein
MPTSTADVSSSFQAWLKNTTLPVSDPNNIFQAPTYTMQGFKDTAENWVRRFSDPNRKDIVWDMDIQSLEHSNFTSLGHSEAHTSSGNSIWIFFSQESRHDETHDTKSVQLHDASQDVKLSLKFVGLQTFSLGTGQWDVPGVQNLFPNLLSGAAGGLGESLIKISAILVGYGVGLDASFSGSVRDEVNTFMANAFSDSSTGTRVFGINFGTDSSSSSSNSVSTDQVKYNSSTGALSIPQINSGYVSPQPYKYSRMLCRQRYTQCPCAPRPARQTRRAAPPLTNERANAIAHATANRSKVRA